MSLSFEFRLSDSPFVETVWRSQSDYSGDFVSMALSNWQMVVTKRHGKLTFTVRGPETRATPAFCPPDGEWIGIFFKPGTFMPHLPNSQLVDRDLNLPDATGKSFWLQGSAWQFPDFENADTFVDRLVREGLLAQDIAITSALQDIPQALSSRSIERRFIHAAGMRQGVIRQIERARLATNLLKQGVSILDTVDLAGYADQPHLTRSLKYYIGQTPSQIIRPNNPEPLSVLFKTPVFS